MSMLASVEICDQIPGRNIRGRYLFFTCLVAQCTVSWFTFLDPYEVAHPRDSIMWPMISQVVHPRLVR